MVDWVYVFLLVAGGIMGMVKADSKVSLFASIAFAIPIMLCNLGVIQYVVPETNGRIDLVDLLLFLLVLVFAGRLAKTKKFMPSGMMIMTTIAALALRHLL